jgi:hypothetical protein
MLSADAVLFAAATVPGTVWVALTLRYARRHRPGAHPGCYLSSWSYPEHSPFVLARGAFQTHLSYGGLVLLVALIMTVCGEPIAGAAFGSCAGLELWMGLRHLPPGASWRRTGWAAWAMITGREYSPDL